ncbi:hypothetical protein ANN_06440, partial [Periplaneta americana]
LGESRLFQALIRNVPEGVAATGKSLRLSEAVHASLRRPKICTALSLTGQDNNPHKGTCADKNSIKHTTMRVLLFQTIAPGIPLPPQPVMTRWETWLDAVNYFAEHYSKIMEVIDALDSTDSSAVAAVKSLPSEQLLEDILFIDSNFKIVSKSIILLESSELQLSEALNIVDKVSQTVIQNNKSLISEKVKLLNYGFDAQSPGTVVAYEYIDVHQSNDTFKLLHRTNAMYPNDFKLLEREAYYGKVPINKKKVEDVSKDDSDDEEDEFAFICTGSQKEDTSNRINGYMDNTHSEQLRRNRIPEAFQATEINI